MVNKLYEFSTFDGGPLLTRPLFVNFEGIDGSGKDKQLIRLLELIVDDGNGFLGNKYTPIWRTREPTKLTESGTKIAKLIRERDVSKEEAAKYFIGDRIEHSQKYIVPFRDHSFVLSSRQDLSTLAYQMTQGMSFEDLYRMHNYGPSGTLVPDITLYFEVSVEEALRRTSGRDSVEECFEKLDFQKKLGASYDLVIDKLKKLQPNRHIIRVNGEQSIEEVSKEMTNKIANVVRNNYSFFKPLNNSS